MKYINGNNVLPEEMIKAIQEYVDGEFVYIPRKNDSHKAWGEKSGTRYMLKNRNAEIFEKHNDGMSVRKLAQMYYLSEQSIRRIIREKKKLCA
ncbi:hypothetical protein KQI89_11165 [Clostridium sp. MSJ-4]|uniref:Mor transcription activator domain-containing protein n=1 Tax=Clostridium simiarum TaxID=2841506 RepID=A0ABS6F251_9CLOT|nr:MULTISPECIES: CD3324 family protein [Clostridium]MBU5592323.1 hypothetical protein [Clostridium simiarum]